MNKRVVGKEKGITLIALIVTIVILIILAGVSINLVLGDNGIINKAQEAQKEYSKQEAREKLELVLLDLQVLKEQDELYNENQYINNRIIKEGMEISENIITVNGWKFEIDRSIPEIKKNIDEEEIKDNVLLEYKLKENERNISKKIPTTLVDNNNNGVNASIKNVTYNNEQTGIVFNGTSSYAQIDSSKLNITFPTTISMTVKCEESDARVIFADTNSKIGIGIYRNKILLSITDYSYFYEVPEGFYTNEYNYITVIYGTKATDNNVYVNGKELSKRTDRDGWSVSRKGTYIGLKPTTNIGDYYFKGILYNFEIYNKIFTQDEIIEKYELDKKWLQENQERTKVNEENLILDYSIKGNNTNENVVKPYILKNLGKNELDAVLYNADYNSDKTGIVFDGTSSYAQIDSSKLNITFPTTISMIVKCKESDARVIFADTNSKIGIGIKGNRILLSITDASYFYEVPEGFYTNEYNYITVIYGDKATDNNVYVNGKELSKRTDKDGWSVSRKGTYIGLRPNGNPGSYYFKGILYKLKIYNQSFSEDEVLNEYQNDKKYFEIL